MTRILKTRPEYLLLFLALILRIAFVFLAARHYFGRENIYVDGDTYSFVWSFQSLYETGTYTVNPGLEFGYFGRMPGYPFFIGFFYMITGNNWETAFIIISWVQLLLDILSGWLLYLTALKISNNRRIALITLFLYATYPFVIVWNPVIYAETLGVFLTVATLYFFVNRDRKSSLMISGVLVGYGILVRPQAFMAIPVILLILLLENYHNIKALIIKGLLFLLPVLLLYGGWPLRNYCNHHKVIFTQDLRGFYNWDTDVMAFWAYVYSVKSEWDPQYTQLISNQKVQWPAESYRTTEDSVMLERAVYLAQHCGSGFSHKMGYWKEPFNTPNCNQEIQSLFLKLRDNQIKYNPWNFYVKVPLVNLKKAFFKSALYDNGSLVRKLASLLFYYRTILLLLGFVFYFFLIIKKEYRNKDHLFPVIFLCLLYLILCAGTSVPLRNIEMRYFLPADVLFLLPASFSIYFLMLRLGFWKNSL